MSTPAPVAATPLPPALWRVLPAALPVPVPAGRDWDTATFNAGRGWRVMGILRAGGTAMGPFLYCGRHLMIHLPITPWPCLPTHQLLTVRRATVSCAAVSPACAGAIWHLSPARPVELTDARSVFDAVHLVRSSACMSWPSAGHPPIAHV